MRLGINLGYWGAGMDADNLAVAREADRLGYSVCWAAEAYGSDAPTVLAWVAAQTERIDVGSAIFQIPARAPAMTAMTAATLDSLSGGRFRLGLGVSGPQVSEGWYGVQVRQAAGPHPRVRRDRPQGDVPRAPDATRASTGRCRCPAGPASRSSSPSTRCASRSRSTSPPSAPRTSSRPGRSPTARCWSSSPPEHAEETTLRHLRAGREKAGKTLEGFDVVPDRAAWPSATTSTRWPTSSAPTPPCTSAAWAAASRTSTTSSRGAWATRRRPPRSRRSTWPATRRAPPPPCRSELIDSTTLLGPVERIADRMQAYAEAGVTTLSLAPAGFTLDERLDGAARRRGGAGARGAGG